MIKKYDLNSYVTEESSKVDSPDLIQSKPLVSRTFFHSQSMMPIAWEDLNQDSEDEPDIKWLFDKKSQVPPLFTHLDDQ